MRIPEAVKIGGMTYKISFVDRINADPELDGQIRYSLGEILLLKCADYPNDYKAKVFIHELVHGIIHHMQIKFDSDEKEETVTEQIANGLAMVIKDNPELFKD